MVKDKNPATCILDDLEVKRVNLMSQSIVKMNFVSVYDNLMKRKANLRIRQDNPIQFV